MDENRCINSSELYHVCTSVYINFCMQRENNLNIPYDLITNKNTFAKKMPFYFEIYLSTANGA